MLKRFYLILFAICITVMSAQAQEEKYIGLFLYNFTKFFDWPESSKSGDFLIQVIGHRSVYDELSRITAGKKVGAQNIVVESIASPDQIRACNMLFVGHWQTRHMPAVLEKTGGKPILLITEMEGLLDKGSCINFVIRDGTIKFELHNGNTASRQLKVDARIRELAYKVVE